MADAKKAVMSYLVGNRVIDEQTALELEELSTKENSTLGSTLINSGYFTKEDLIILLLGFYKNGSITIEDVNSEFSLDTEEFLKTFASEAGLEYIDLDAVDIDYKIAKRVPIAQLKKYEALPIKEDDISVYVTIKDPLSFQSQEAVQRLFNKKLVKIVVADPTLIEKYMNKMELSESIKGLISEIRKELSSSGGDNTQESSGILKLIEIVLKTSILSRASDIHIEPTENNCIVRSRIDGILTETFIFEKDIYPPLCSRLKLLSNMDIAEKRKPQDGRFSAKIMGREFDFRISALPIIFGESIVLRILDKSKVMIKLESLGMHPENYAKFSKAMRAPYGIILVTGPTGSGKSTTLYAALNAIKSIETKIITVEDPVEYQLNLIQQVHVNEKANLTFASALRSILRQDPDIIMIGEIRDQETLRIAIQAALTGHLVFSTLHTNDSISAVTRILDMGIEPYLVSGALVAIEAQRLIRKLCPACKATVNLPNALYSQIESYLPQPYQFYKAVGCEKCSQTGYSGREMISEILPVSETLASMVAQGATKEQLKQQALREGFIDLFKDGIIRASRGVTSVEEILRVAKS